MSCYINLPASFYRLFLKIKINFIGPDNSTPKTQIALYKPNKTFWQFKRALFKIAEKMNTHSERKKCY